MSNWSVGSIMVTIMVAMVFNGAGWQMVSGSGVVGWGSIVSGGSIVGWGSMVGNDGMMDGRSVGGVHMVGWGSVHGMHNWGGMVGNDWCSVDGMSVNGWGALGDDCVEAIVVVGGVVDGAD